MPCPVLYAPRACIHINQNKMQKILQHFKPKKTMKTLKITLSILFVVLIGITAEAQIKVGDNPLTIDDGSILELESTNKAFVLPRMTTGQRDLISTPLKSAMIFNTSENCIQMNIGTPAQPIWECLTYGGIDKDEQKITNFSFDEASGKITLELENGGGVHEITVTDNQQLTINGNDLILENGGVVNLEPYLDNTDKQLITAFSFDETTKKLSITLERGNTQEVDLSFLDNDGADEQQILDFTITNNLLTLELERGGAPVNVDLTPYVDQQIEDFTITNNVLTLTLEDGGTQMVDLSQYLDNTDNQAITATLSDKTLVIDLERGGSQTVDLSFFDNEGTDDQQVQNFSYDDVANTITLQVEDGGDPITISLADLNDAGSDDQQVQNFSYDDVAKTITLQVEDGGDPITISLADLNDAGSDDQNLESATINNNELTIAIEDGNDVTVDLSQFVDTDNQGITATLSDKTLVIDLERGGSQTVDLSFFDNEGTDDQQVQNFSYDDVAKTITLQVEDGGDPITISLADLNDAGSDDQNLESATINNNELTIAIEDGNDVTVDLSQFVDTDDQGIENFSFDPNTGDLTLQIEDGGDAATITLGDLFENIYTVDGTLEANRTVSMDGKTLNFNGTDAVVIHPDGKMSIGKTTVNPQVELEVDGDILAVQVHASSDARFKKDVNTLTEALSKVNQMRGVSYNFDQAAFPARNFPAEKQVGFIAQEIEKVLPEVVMTDNEGFKAVDYSKVTALLTEAVKEQQKQIELLNQKLKQSESANEVVMSELASIKDMILSIQKTKVQVQTADQD